MTETETTKTTDAKATRAAAKEPGAKAAKPAAKTTSPKTKRRQEIAQAKAELAARAAEEAAAADCADAGLNAEATAEVTELADGCTGMVPPADTDEQWEASAGVAQPEPEPEPEAVEAGPDPDAELTFKAANGGTRTVRAAAVKAVRDGAMMIDPTNPKGGRTIRGSIVFVERTVVRAKQNTTSVVEIESADPAETIRERLAEIGYGDVPERPAARRRQVNEAKPAKAKAERGPRPEGERQRKVITGRSRMSDADALARAKEIIKAADGKTTRWKVIAQLREEGNQVAFKPLFEAFDREGLVPTGRRSG